ncbi:DUF6314 family protein [Actinoalloteichus sp. AHMU CJ021]|uniref:DUF6314 family protein n=1 Tax=Actinoalloteichus sp. AHMU CJ021 TaxID=2072503 RepID=UPI003FCED9D0
MCGIARPVGGGGCPVARWVEPGHPGPPVVPGSHRAWAQRWRVTGPAKNHVIATDYHRGG